MLSKLETDLSGESQYWRGFCDWSQMILQPLFQNMVEDYFRSFVTMEVPEQKNAFFPVDFLQ